MFKNDALWQFKIRLYSVLFALVVMISFVMSVVVVHADPTDVASYSSDVKTEMVSTYGTKKYVTSGGGSYTVNDLLIGSTDPATNNIWIVNEVNFNALTSSAKSEFLADLNSCAEKVTSPGNAQGYTAETTTNWYSILQQQDGVGSKMLNVILKDTKPDYVTAGRIYAPFSGLVGTVLGLGCILIMAFLTIVIVLDICYIALPPVRLFIADDDKGNGNIKSKLFSHDAIYAVKCAEEDNSGNGSPKQALGIYFKRRVLMLFLLAICLLYLVQGSIFSFIGGLLDLMSGFTG